MGRITYADTFLFKNSILSALIIQTKLSLDRKLLFLRIYINTQTKKQTSVKIFIILGKNQWLESNNAALYILAHIVKVGFLLTKTS